MKRIFIAAPEQGMGTNVYRSTMPLSDLRRRFNLEVVTSHDIKWDHAAYFDFAYFSWPNSKHALDAMANFKFMGVPIWVDFDDDPWNLPSDNPVADAYKAGGAVIASIEQAVQEADVVTVSTERLKTTFGKHSKRVEVIPNAYWDQLWPMSKAPRKKAILWRGALGHNKDLESVFPQIAAIQDKYPDWPWIFVGEPDPELIKLLDPKITIRIPYQHPNVYIRTMIDLACPIQIVPLLNHEFNLNKSNCSWLEATCAGTAVIAPSYLPEFRKPGITNYDAPEDFMQKLEHLMNNNAEAEALVDKSRWAIGKEYLLTNVNDKRKRILGL